MKTRRHTAHRWLFSLLLAALTGCVEQMVVPEPDPQYGDMPLVFSASPMNVMTVATKAGNFPNDTPNSPLDDNNCRITVFGYRSLDNDLLFDYEEVKRANGKWTYTPLQYWRHSGDYKFMAVYGPTLDHNTCSYSAAQNRLVATYRMHGDDFDLMVADAQRLDLSTDYLHKTDTVDLHFKHACAAVRFLFRKGLDAGDNDYYLHSFELQKVQTVGTFIYDAGSTVTASSWYVAEYLDPRVLVWNAASPAENKEVPDSYANYLSAYAATTARWHYVIPQQISDKTAAINFSVLVNENNDDTVPVYTTLELPAITWEPGKVYTYYIQIQPGTADITVTAIPWDEYDVATDDIIF